MADIFTKNDIKTLFQGKFILILGDSNFRALYRDVVWLLNNNSITPQDHLRRKLDFSYLGDRLIKRGQLNRGRDYVEMREYMQNDFHIKFNFITKCITPEVERMLQDYKEKKCRVPDVVIINSCLWDITRWGPDGVNHYKENMTKLLGLFKSSLPSSTLVVFSATPPVSQCCTAAFLVKQVEFMKHTLRFEVMEANLFARQLVPTYSYNMLDIHYHLRFQIHRRAKDGVHWESFAVRHITNLFLTHIALAWDVALPHNYKGKLVEKMKEKVNRLKESVKAEERSRPEINMCKGVSMPPPRDIPKRKRNQQPNRPGFYGNENVPIIQGAPLQYQDTPSRGRKPVFDNINCISNHLPYSRNPYYGDTSQWYNHPFTSSSGHRILADCNPNMNHLPYSNIPQHRDAPVQYNHPFISDSGHRSNLGDFSNVNTLPFLNFDSGNYEPFKPLTPPHFPMKFTEDTYTNDFTQRDSFYHVDGRQNWKETHVSHRPKYKHNFPPYYRPY